MKAVLSQGLAAAICPRAWEGRLAGRPRSACSPAYPVVRLFASPRTRPARRISPGGRARLAMDDVIDPALCAARRPGQPRQRPRRTGGLFSPSRMASPCFFPVLPLTIVRRPRARLLSRPRGGRRPPVRPAPRLSLRGRAARAGRLAAAPGRRRLRAAEPGPRRGPGRRARLGPDGPYVRAVFPAAEYPRVHAEFLRAGVLLHPAYPGPSVLPGECSPGENRLLADLFAGIPGG